VGVGAGAGAGDDDAAAAARVAHAYDHLADLGREGRARSGILHLRHLNNWVKATLIQQCAPRPCHRVLDLACGKGGDLAKWLRCGMTRYCAVDISRQGIEDAAARFNEACNGGGSGGGGGGSGATAKFVRADLGVTNLGARGVLAPDEQFDAISVQFALHYLFQSEARALCFFRNIAGRLAPGGVFLGTIPDAAVLVRRLRDAAGPPDAGAGGGEGAGAADADAGAVAFGNGVCSVTFPRASVRAQWGLGAAPFGVAYTFYLADREVGGAPVDHVVEYLVPWPLLERLARACGLRPVARENFHAWFHRALGAAGSLGREARLTLGKMAVLDCEGTVPAEDWEVAGLYRVFAFELDPDAAAAAEAAAASTGDDAGSAEAAEAAMEGADEDGAPLLREALESRRRARAQAQAPAPAMPYRSSITAADIADL
jgi:mRNA (guanine-N7-)-methyltransferase